MYLHVKVSDEVLKQFKQKVIRRYGSLRGYLPKAVEEALKLWMKEN